LIWGKKEERKKGIEIDKIGHLWRLSRLNNLRKPKVNQFQMIVFLVDENIVRFDVAVENLGTRHKKKKKKNAETTRNSNVMEVAERDGRAQLKEEVLRRSFRETSGRDEVEEVCGADVFHAHIQPPVHPKPLLQMDDVAVLKPRHYLDLPQVLGLQRLLCHVGVMIHRHQLRQIHDFHRELHQTAGWSAIKLQHPNKRTSHLSPLPTSRCHPDFAVPSPPYHTPNQPSPTFQTLRDTQSPFHHLMAKWKEEKWNE
jgi:hypothetical protein